MRVIVNGEHHDLVHPTVATVVAELGHDTGGRGIAVALNGEVVRRADWSSTVLTEDDRVEVLSAVGGG